MSRQPALGRTGRAGAHWARRRRRRGQAWAQAWQQDGRWAGLGVLGAGLGVQARRQQAWQQADGRAGTARACADGRAGTARACADGRAGAGRASGRALGARALGAQDERAHRRWALGRWARWASGRAAGARGRASGRAAGRAGALLGARCARGMAGRQHGRAACAHRLGQLGARALGLVFSSVFRLSIFPESQNEHCSL